MGEVTPNDRPIEIVPSVLPADFSRLGDECIALEKAGVDRIQLDVMDGRFVPNLTFGPDVIASVRPHVTVPFEAHLMVHEPDGLAPRLRRGGVRACSSCTRKRAPICTARWATSASSGAQAGGRPQPAHAHRTVEHVLDLVDLVLVMTVNPGFGGQTYIATMEPKIRRLAARHRRARPRRRHRGRRRHRPGHRGGAAAAGANVLVAGSALFRDEQGLDARGDAARSATSGAVGSPALTLGQGEARGRRCGTRRRPASTARTALDAAASEVGVIWWGADACGKRYGRVGSTARSTRPAFAPADVAHVWHRVDPRASAARHRRHARCRRALAASVSASRTYRPPVTLGRVDRSDPA